MTPTTRKSLAALRAAAKVIRSTRKAIFDGHVELGTYPRKVTDPGALAWIAEQDEALAKVSAAIKAIIKDNQ